MSEYGNPEIRITGSDQTGPAFDSANAHAEGLRNTTAQLAGDMVANAAKMVASVFTVSEAFKGLKELIGETVKTADELRDLQASLQVLSSSVKEGVNSWKFFEEEQKNTRATAIELASMYRDVLPVAMKRFGEEGTRQLTVMLAQIAPLMGKTAQEMDDAFKKLLMGRVLGTNPLLVALGMSKEDFKAAGGFSDEMIQKMASLAKQGEELGQTFESTAHKIKAEWFDALGEGFNQQRNDADAALKSMRDELTNPETISGLHALGAAFSATFTVMVNTLDWFDGKFKDFLSLVGDLHGFADAPPDAYGKGTTPGTVQRSQDIALGKGFTQGITSVTGGGSLQQMQQQLGEMSRTMDSKQFTNALVAIRDEVQNGSIKWMDYRTSVDWVKAGMVELPRDLGAASAALKEFNDLVDKAVSGAPGRLGGKGIPTLQGNAGPFPDFTNSLNQTLGNMPQSATPFGLTLGIGSLTPGEDPMVKWAREWAHEVDMRLHDTVTNQFSTDIAGIFESGGKNFSKIMGKNFNVMIQEGADTLAAAIFGKRGDLAKGQDPNQLYDLSGNVMSSSTTSRVGAAAVGAAQIGFGAYSNTLAGGSRTAGTISGGLAGAGLGAEIGSAIPGIGTIVGGVVGAVVGLVVGAIGSYMGAAASRADYQYGIPGVDNTGLATLKDTKNLTPAAALQMQQSVQAQYDTFRNSYMHTSMTLGMGAPADLGQINGMFQDAPSGHWAEHFQQWLSGTLPADIAKQFQATMKEGFGNAGLGGTQFDAIYAKWSNLDPAKMASMFDGLATFMTGVSKATGYFKGSVNENYNAAFGDVNATFTDSLKTSDVDILKFATNLKSLVGEDQINGAKQLATMLTDRMNSEKAFLQDIIKMTEQAHQQISDAKNNLTLMGMKNPDGTVDYSGQGQYLRGVANQDLTRISSSKTVADADQWLQRYINDINQIVGLGYNINAQTGDDWRKWALDQLGLGQNAFDKLSNSQQNDVKSANDAFLAQFDPAMQGIVDSISGVSSVVVNIGDDFNRLHDPLDRFRVGINSVNDGIASLVATLKAANSSSAAFAASTAKSRAA